MRKIWKSFGVAPLLMGLGAVPAAALDEMPAMHQYIFFGMDRERIAEPAFLSSNAGGAQLKYTWRELEPEKGRYDFSAVAHDLAFLTAHHKRLWMQLQEATFHSEHKLVPRYLLEDQRYHGGAAPEYWDASGAPGGWVARRWDPAVRGRFAALLQALGKAFDGRIAGINLPETAIDFGRKLPSGFTPGGYARAVVDSMAALRAAFPRSETMQYANFMPGEWLPDEDHGYLREVYERARALGVAVGGPDLLPGKPSQMHHAYQFMHELGGSRLHVGIAVQDGNFAFVAPRTRRRLSVRELVTFARDYLHADTIFWCTEEPYYSREVLPALSSLAWPKAVDGVPRPSPP